MINDKKSKVLIWCLALLLVMAVGYALFSENITINGTATAKGDFDISFACELLTEDFTYGEDTYISGTIGGTGECIINGQTITMTSTLTKPTDIVSYKVTLTNTGSIPAVLKTVDSSNNVADGLSSAGDEFYFDRTNYLFGAYDFYKEGVTFSTGNTISGDSTVENEKITLKPNETLTLIVTNLWADSNMVGESQTALPEEGVKMNYNITLGFEQVQAQ